MWPYYGFTDRPSLSCEEVELPESEIRRMQGIITEFFKVQEELEELYESAEEEEKEEG